MNKSGVQNIMKSRKKVTRAHALNSDKVKLTIASKGTMIEVRNSKGELVDSAVNPGEKFTKVIFNTNLSSDIALQNPLFQKLAMDAYGHETNGDVEKADELYRQFLNKTQVSFSVPSTSSLLTSLGVNVDIKARVILIKTEKGELLTIDPKTIEIAQAIELAPTEFSFDTFIAEMNVKNEKKVDAVAALTA